MLDSSCNTHTPYPIPHTRAKKKLEKANAKKENFLATMSHKRRTAMNAIKCNGDMILQGDIFQDGRVIVKK